jgi:hypothetical protein
MDKSFNHYDQRAESGCKPDVVNWETLVRHKGDSFSMLIAKIAQ